MDAYTMVGLSYRHAVDDALHWYQNTTKMWWNYNRHDASLCTPKPPVCFFYKTCSDSLLHRTRLLKIFVHTQQLHWSTCSLAHCSVHRHIRHIGYELISIWTRRGSESSHSLKQTSVDLHVNRPQRLRTKQNVKKQKSMFIDVARMVTVPATMLYIVCLSLFLLAFYVTWSSYLMARTSETWDSFVISST